jgi:hypothetical protein
MSVPRNRISYLKFSAEQTVPSLCILILDLQVLSDDADRP